MSGVPQVRALLLAAGAGCRYGRLKQLETLCGQSLVRRAALTVLAAGLPLEVVIGAEADRVRSELEDLPLRLIENPHWQQGMGGSIACALAPATLEDTAAVVIVLADQALLRTDDLQALVHAHRAHPQAILAADYGPTLGPPCLFPGAYLRELRALSGDRGAGALLRRHQDVVRSLPMPHAGVDVDAPADLARVAAGLAKPP